MMNMYGNGMKQSNVKAGIEILVPMLRIILLKQRHLLLPVLLVLRHCLKLVLLQTRLAGRQHQLAPRVVFVGL